MIQLRKEQYRKDYQAPDYTITDIELDFELDPITTIVTAISQVKRLNAQANRLILDGENLILRTIHIDGIPWSAYREEVGKLIIESVPDSFVLKIVNTINPIQNTTLEGLYVSSGVLCTQCEAEGFRHITYYLDRPDVLARFTTSITANRIHYPYLLSNGNQIDKKKKKNGRHWVKWQDPFPKPSYLFAMVAGNFDVLYDNFVRKSGRNVLLAIFVDKGKLDHANWAMSSLKNAMKWDELRFGYEYDLDTYMIVAVDIFNMGAMENKGLNIFNSKYVLANIETTTDNDYLNIEGTIGHEYFHNWTGNRITCRDWFQLSLKEGLTVFRDQEFSSDMGSRVANRIEHVRLMRSQQFSEDASPMSHPVRPEKMIEINNFYTLTVYEKGAEIIRMLHTLLGKDQFQAGMKLYTARYDGSSATCDDFIQAMQDASNIDLQLFRRWYSQSGTPIVMVRDEYLSDKNQYILHISQTTRPTQDQAEKLPLHIPIDIELYDSDGHIIPLQYNNNTVNSVLNVINAQQTFVFDQVHSRPIPALLREFSAPVKLDYLYTDEQLAFLMQYARNAFSRWDSAQSLLVIYIKENVERLKHQKDLILPLHVIHAFRSCLVDKACEAALKAQIFTLPAEYEVAEWFETIDPIAIHTVMNFIRKKITTEMTAELINAYYTNKVSEYQIDHGDIAKRSLKNKCLFYLAFSQDKQQADKYVSEQYYHSNNMTDTIAALNAAIAAQLPSSQDMMVAFEQRWRYDDFIMDKWFMLQAKSPAKNVLKIVRSLLTHPTFSMANPNRVHALIGSFITQNPAAFHASDGTGYQFLVEILTILNSRNPQVASHLIEPLIHLNRYDKKRRYCMYLALKRLQKLPNLCSDMFEKISKALENH
ncbi:MAG: aminopeptidase N [Candidatus Arsenophonus melophagi]|nr:aminopeptidase N [Candidatus Arsenophonus melophagi]